MIAIAKVINQQQPDLVALQEVDVHTNRSGKQLNQAAELARQTGMKAYFAKAIDYDGGEYGVAILSKHPIENTQVYKLPTAADTNGEPRVLATAVVIINGKRLRFASTHLDAQRSDTNRLLQVQQIVNLLQTDSLPVIIAGDLNAAPGSPVINIFDRAFTRTCVNCAFTIPVINPTKTIDFIAYTGSFTVKDHKVIAETYASDHLPVMAVLNMQ